MDSALTKELSQYRKRRANNADGSKTQAQKGRSTYRGMPQSMKKKGATTAGPSKRSYHCKNKTRPGLLSCIVDYLRDQYLDHNRRIFTAIKSTSQMSPLLREKMMMPKHNENKSVLAWLTIEKILDLTQNMGASQQDVLWLRDDALQHNPRVSFKTEDDQLKFQYNPKYTITSKKDFLKLLEKHVEEGLGGIAVDDLKECVGNMELAMKSINKHFFCLSRSSDKRETLYHFDGQYELTIDNDYKAMWAKANQVTDKQVEDYLQKSNIKHYAVDAVVKQRLDEMRGVNNVNKPN